MVAGKYHKAQNMSLKKDIKPDFLQQHGFSTGASCKTPPLQPLPWGGLRKLSYFQMVDIMRAGQDDRKTIFARGSRGNSHRRWRFPKTWISF
jgi:hypothetical protein